MRALPGEELDPSQLDTAQYGDPFGPVATPELGPGGIKNIGGPPSDDPGAPMAFPGSVPSFNYTPPPVDPGGDPASALPSAPDGVQFGADGQPMLPVQGYDPSALGGQRGIGGPPSQSSQPSQAPASPAGLPSTAQVAGTAPLPLQAFGGIPSVTPTYGTAAQVGAPDTPNAAGVDPAQMSAYLAQAAQMDPAFAGSASMNPYFAQAARMGTPMTRASIVDPAQNQQYLNQYEGLVEQSLATGYQRQLMQLEDNNRARGISNSGAASELEGNLLGQQAAGTAAAIAPFVSQEAGYTQSDIAANQANRQQAGLANQGAALTAGQTNLGAQQQTTLANQGAAMTAAGTNAAHQQQSILSNQNAANTAGQYNAGNRQQVGLANQGAQMSAAQTNVGNRQQANMTNASAVNQFVAQGYSYQEANMLANQQAQNSFTARNQDTANQATATNAGYYNEALTGNAAAYNTYLAQLYNTGSSTANSELAAYLNSFGPNSGVTSAMNTGLAGAQNAYTSIYGQAASGQGAALGGLGQGLGSYFGAAAAAGG